jgi:hypothetical protein
MGHSDSDLLNLYQEVAPAEEFRRLQGECGKAARDGIYSARLVIWMMMQQRLQPRGSLATSVAELVQGRFDPLLSQCKRVREHKIGVSTGGYCQAREKLPERLVSRSVEEVLEKLRQRITERSACKGPRSYVLDGSSVQLEHCPELMRKYPPGRNRYGAAHWPVVRMVVLHDVETGLAERPWWGPMYGRRAVSEQGLAEQAIQHVPAGSVIIGDRNFGIFWTVWRAQEHDQEVIVRLTGVRARKLAGGPIARAEDSPMLWRSSRWDGKQSRDWPVGASVLGRLIACRVGRGKHTQWLYLFTTLSLPVEQVVRLYGKRWNIETDLRSLKHTIGLQHISAQSDEMLEKELLVATLAYNLVRTIMCLAAQRTQGDPRRISFTRACHLVLNGLPQILAAPTARQQRAGLDQLIKWVGQCKLPNRKKRRSYPRQVWSRGFQFPARKRAQN